ncbi:MAG: ABC transporter substrate-binding protein [Actinomycetota bacterium]
MLRAGAIALMLSLGACGFVGGDDGGGGAVTVGAVTFAENQIVAEMYARVLEDAGYNVDRRFNYQSREDLLPDLSSGAVDVSPEYLASLLTALDPQATPSSDPQANVGALDPLLSERDLELLDPSEANNTNAIVVDEATAQEFGLETVSDLQPHAGRLEFGGPPECPKRRFCLEGLRDVYGLEFADFRPLDAGGPLTIAALSNGEIDVALLFSTSAVIQERGWIVLEDDQELQAAENITPVVRRDVLDDKMEERLNRLSRVLTTETMTDLNARVEISNEDFRSVAREFLGDNGLQAGAF